MHDTLLDDVNKLLFKEKGDRRVLEQIRRAAENGEVISVYERNYVAKLRDEFLAPQRPAGRKPQQQPAAKPQTYAYAPPVAPLPRKKGTRRTKFLIGGGAGSLAVLAVVAAMFPFASTLELNLDASAYSAGEIISISGVSDASVADTALVFIERANSAVWSEEIHIRADGTFSTLAIAGGVGWGGGTYTLSIRHADLTESLEFEFLG